MTTKCRKELKTNGKGNTFTYEGSVTEGTVIFYGKKSAKAMVTSAQYAEIIKNFKGKKVRKGTSRTSPPKGSLGEWLNANISNTALSSYICAILVSEGYAEVEKADIHFKCE